MEAVAVALVVVVRAVEVAARAMEEVERAVEVAARAMEEVERAVEAEEKEAAAMCPSRPAVSTMGTIELALLRL